MDACVRLLAIVHARDQYPLLWPDDAITWLSPRGIIAAWVAERNGSVLGHVALHHPGRDGGGVEWLESLGLCPSQIAWISRLFVDPAARRRGLGSYLLNAALRHASRLGLRAALEVVETDRDAIALYERYGWIRVQSRAWILPSGAKTLVHSYLAPAEPAEK